MLQVTNIRYGILILFTTIFVYLFVTEYRDKAKVIHPQSRWPSTDWVIWEDTDDGVIAKHIMPPAADNKYLTENYIHNGDRLVSIDYQRIRNVEQCKKIIHNAGVGNILYYQIATEKNSITKNERGLFVLMAYRPFYLFASNYYLWKIYFIITIIGSISCLFLVFVLLPFLKSNLKSSFAIFVLLFFTLLLFLFQLVHNFVVSYDYSFSLFQLERFFAIAFCISFCVVSFSITLIYTNINKWVNVLNFGLMLYISTFCVFVIISNKIIIYDTLVVKLLSVYLLLNLVFVPFSKVNDVHQNTKTYVQWGSFIIISSLIIFYLSSFAVAYRPSVHNWVQLSTQILVFLPLVQTTRSVLLFGKVNVVLTRTLSYVLLIVVFILLFLFLNNILSDLHLNPYTQGVLQTLILSAVFIISNYIYKKYEYQLVKYFITPSRRKENELATFLAAVPRYINTHELIDAVENFIKSNFGTEKCSVLVKNNWGDIATNLDETVFEKLIDKLREKNDFWSKSKELSDIVLEGKSETELIGANIALVFPLHYGDNKHGLLVLGNKKAGVFNMEDTSQLLRIAQQLQMAIEILNLLEKEKILVEKTMEANLIALRSQINPHFLFNTFNSISALIHDSPDLAEEALEKLAFIFRYTLRFSKEKYLTVENEMSLVRNYLDIEQIRFGKRLKIEINVDPLSVSYLVPAFVLQTIIENCIKHGINKIIGNGLIQIDISVENNQVIFSIFDNGPGIDLQKIKNGTGLNNIIARLQALYNRDDLIVFKNTGNGTLVTFTVPTTTK